MRAVDVLLNPEECGMLFVDFQARRGFGVGLRTREMIHPG
jgi:hypothetical protein